jgi:hypothetical protein
MAISGEIVAKLAALLKDAEVHVENSKILINGKVMTLHQFGHEEIENFHKLTDGLKEDLMNKIHAEAIKILEVADKVDLAVESGTEKLDVEIKKAQQEEAAKIVEESEEDTDS